jgi:hypothetical protein
MKNFNLLLIIILFLSINLFADGVQPIGSGSEENPFQIETLDNLLWFSTNDSTWAPGYYFIQVTDIDASDTENWNEGEGFNPIGYNDNFADDFLDHPFSAIYDGQGYVIENLYIHRSITGQSFFGLIENAVIKNLGLINANVFGMTAAILVYEVASSDVHSCYSTGVVYGGYSVSGLIGRIISPSIISNCYSLCSVSGGNALGAIISGLIASIGCLETDSTNIVINCYFAGNIDGAGLEHETSGGLIGRDWYNTNITLDSFWDIETSGQTTSAGGTGKTTSEMQSLSTFIDAGWDFMDETVNGSNDYWGINPEENNAYPFLEWQGYEHNPSLTAPVIDSFNIDNNIIVISWSSVIGATSYNIYRSTDPNNFGDVYDTTTDTIWTNNEASSKMFYCIRAKN